MKGSLDNFANKMLSEIQQSTIKIVEDNPEFQKSTFNRFDIDDEIDHKKLETETTIKVVNGDTLQTTIEFQKKTGKRFCFLILANAYYPGGGWLEGANAQEESVCRRSNVFLAFKKVKYPLDEFGGIYGKNVVIFRDTIDSNFKLLKEPCITDCVFVAAYSNPILKSEKVMKKRFEIGTKYKIVSMLDECLKKGNRNLVLGALGCGAFANPPEHVAQIFKKVLNSERFKNRFETVVFAIIDNKHTTNFNTFKKILEN